MSEHGTTSRPIDDLGLTSADLERALATTRSRGGRLLRRRQQRRAAFSALGVVALLAGGFGVLNSLSDDAADVVVTPAGPSGAAGDTPLTPAASTTTSPPVSTTLVEPGAPAGFTRSDLADGVVLLQNGTPPASTTTTAPGGVAIGTAAAVDRRAAVTGFTVEAPRRMSIELACEGAANHLDRVLYRLADDVVTVQAVMVHDAAEAPCADPVGVDLTFSADLPAGVRVEAGLLESE